MAGDDESSVTGPRRNDILTAEHLQQLRSYIQDDASMNVLLAQRMNQQEATYRMRARAEEREAAARSQRRGMFAAIDASGSAGPQYFRMRNDGTTELIDPDIQDVQVEAVEWYSGPNEAPIPGIFQAPEIPGENFKGTDEEYMTLNKMTTMRDARGHHYEIFPGKNDAARGQKEGILKYIEALGVSNQVDVSSWKLSLFHTNGKLITDRRKINEIFFREAKNSEKLKGGVKYAKTSVLKELAARLATGNNQAIVEKQRGLNGASENCRMYLNAIEQNVREVAAMQRDIETRLKKNDDYKREHLKNERLREEAEAELNRLKEEAAKDKDSVLMKQVKELMKTGHFILPEKQEEQIISIDLITKPITHSFFCKKQAKNIIAPLGQYRINTQVNNGNWIVKVFKHRGNTVAGAHIHPHISRENGLCMGAAKVPFQEAVKKQDFFGAMMAVWAVLAEFAEDGNPYVDLYKFEEAYCKKVKEKTARKAERKQEQNQAEEIPF